MSFFGAVFAALMMSREWDFSGAVLAVPFIVFAAIGLAAAYVIRLPGSGIAPSKKAERAIMWSSFAEGIGLFVAANIVVNLHRPDLLLPAMALVVGLHFLPIAFVASFWPFYALGAALVLSAAAGFVMGAPSGGTVAGLTAAVGLWIAATIAVRRDLRAKHGFALAV